MVGKMIGKIVVASVYVLNDDFASSGFYASDLAPRFCQEASQHWRTACPSAIHVLHDEFAIQLHTNPLEALPLSMSQHTQETHIFRYVVGRSCSKKAPRFSQCVVSGTGWLQHPQEYRSPSSNCFLVSNTLLSSSTVSPV